MTYSEYCNIRLNIYEQAEAGEITETEKKKMFAFLEAKKEAETVSKDQAVEMLDQIAASFPDLKDDIEDISKKIEKSGDEDSDDSSDDSAEGEETKESTAYEEFTRWLNNER